MGTNVSEEHTASIFRAEGGGNMFVAMQIYDVNLSVSLNKMYIHSDQCFISGESQIKSRNRTNDMHVVIRPSAVHSLATRDKVQANQFTRQTTGP